MFLNITLGFSEHKDTSQGDIDLDSKPQECEEGKASTSNISHSFYWILSEIGD